MNSNEQNQCLQHWFEAQVERTPEAAAVVFPSASPGEAPRSHSEVGRTSPAAGPPGELRPAENEQLTYRQLNRRANQLAHYLRTLGVGPETLVGVWLERSLEMVVGLLAILKAGGAYVPLDLAYPQERLAFVLDDTQRPVLLTDSRLLKELPEQNEQQRQIVCLDTDYSIYGFA